MACLYPKAAWPCPTGDGGLTFSKPMLALGKKMMIPCGKCVGCRVAKANEWATRCVNEASLYEHNCFITLTYDDEHLPVPHLVDGRLTGSVDKRDFQLFMKRLRKHYRGIQETPNPVARERFPIRFYGCSEYGDIGGRPHYHACLFNFDFADKKPFNKTSRGMIYTSETLSKIWGKGHVTVADLTFESARYVASYAIKKRGAEDSVYQVVDDETGEVSFKRQEFGLMSRMPGIGADFYAKYSDDFHGSHDGFMMPLNRVNPNDPVALLSGGLFKARAKKLRVPRYYDKLLKRVDEFRHADIKAKRISSALITPEEFEEYRLQAKRAIADAQRNFRRAGRSL